MALTSYVGLFSSCLPPIENLSFGNNEWSKWPWSIEQLYLEIPWWKDLDCWASATSFHSLAAPVLCDCSMSSPQHSECEKSYLVWCQRQTLRHSLSEPCYSSFAWVVKQATAGIETTRWSAIWLRGFIAAYNYMLNFRFSWQGCLVVWYKDLGFSICHELYSLQSIEPQLSTLYTTQSKVKSVSKFFLRLNIEIIFNLRLPNLTSYHNADQALSHRTSPICCIFCNSFCLY